MPGASLLTRPVSVYGTETEVFVLPPFSPDLAPSDCHVTTSEAPDCKVVCKRH